MSDNNIGAEARAINLEFDKTGVSFHNRAEALAIFKEGRQIVEEDGQLFTHYDGEAKVSLANALLRFGYDRRELVDGRTLPRAGAGTSRPGLVSKSDFATTREKLDWIAAHSAEAWERLPLTGAATSEVTTREEFLKLPRQERMRRYAADPGVLTKLPSTGAFVDNAALAKHIATQGKLAR